MNISFIVAMSENRVIGNHGTLPWHLPNDLKHFKELTVGSNVLMGRKTFESIKKALPYRRNFILSKQIQQDKNITVFRSKEEVLNYPFDDLIIIGGEEIYRLFLPECQKIYLTLVHTIINGDTYFPEFSGFIETSRTRHEPDERHHYAYSFIEYLRIEPCTHHTA